MHALKTQIYFFMFQSRASIHSPTEASGDDELILGTPEYAATSATATTTAVITTQNGSRSLPWVVDTDNTIPAQRGEESPAARPRAAEDLETVWKCLLTVVGTLSGLGGLWKQGLWGVEQK